MSASPTQSTQNELPLISVQDLSVHFPINTGALGKKDVIRAVDHVSFEIPRGSTVGLVGESGSGKTTLGRAILRLIEPTAGKILFEGRDITKLSAREMRPLRKRMQIVFQDPFNSLNPRLTVEQIVGESLEIHFPEVKRQERHERCAALLERVGLQADFLPRYPHQFSGGQRQRIGIARALAVEPDFIVCDEPVSALDVSVQAQIINLLQDIQEQSNITYLFIAHDLAVVEHVSDHILVMYHGEIVESAAAEEIYARPQHEYTQRLLDAVPKLDLT